MYLIPAAHLLDMEVAALPTPGSGNQYSDAPAGSGFAGAEISEGMGGKIVGGLAGSFVSAQIAEDGLGIRSSRGDWPVWWGRRW